MNISIVGPNGAGKSILIRQLVQQDIHALPFSISNFPQDYYENCISKSSSIVERRIQSLVGRWGTCYQKKFYPPERLYLIEEGFLTKLLAICPTTKIEARDFESQFMNFLPKIVEIESSYVDRYFSIELSFNQWLRNRDYRNDSYLQNDLGGIRFTTQSRLLTSYLDFFESERPGSRLTENQLNLIVHEST